jgi:acetyl-CoA C-acetyltransferase
MFVSANGEVVVVGAARTPIGRFGGSLRDVHPAELGAAAAGAAIVRAGLRPEDVDEVIFGHARQAGSGPNPARQVGHRAGVPHGSVAQTVNKACASGMQALVAGAQSLLLGESRVVLVGGMESMSRTPYLMDAADARWGRRMGNATLVDGMYRDGFQCPLSSLLMGETAEVLARQYEINRDETDRFALESQRKAGAAVQSGAFAAEIAPVQVVSKGTTITMNADEHPRPATTLDDLRALKPVFEGVDGYAGILTAGSSSGLADGAAALVLTTSEYAAVNGWVPRARVLGWASAGVDPRIMGIGPVPAVRKLTDRLGIGIDEFDLVELNEAFSAQVLAVLKDIPIASDRLNVNGGAIALGHPIGCTGARILVTLLHEMERRSVRLGLAALCVSGGMGMAVALARM